jgi:nucleoside-diphosphate-sugar epimerase
VDDLTEGVFCLMRSTETRPVNVGNPHEYSVREVAEMIIKISTEISVEISSGSESELVFEPLPKDDPKRHCPEITRTKEVLGWEPRTPVREGLKKTLEWFAERSGNPEASPV